MKDPGRNAGPSPKDKQAQFEARVLGFCSTIEKERNEMVKKHNDMASQLVAQEQMIKQMAAFMASEMGKFQGTVAQHVATLGRSTQGLDMNIFALAELCKELVGQVTQMDFIFQKIGAKDNSLLGVMELSEEDRAKIKEESTRWYNQLVKSCFARAQAEIARQEEAAAEKEKAEREAAEKAALEQEAQSEKAAVNDELKKAAEAERAIVANTSGGPGAAFPDGAEIFGG